MGQHYPGAQPSDNAHPAVGPEGPRDHPDHRPQAAQLQERREDFRHRVETERALLETYSSGLEQQDGGDRLAGPGVPGGQLEGASRLGAGDLADAAALERSLDADHHARLARQPPLDHHHAVVGLRDQALRLEPGRLDPVERVAVLLARSVVEEGKGTSPGIELEETAPVPECLQLRPFGDQSGGVTHCPFLS